MQTPQRNASRGRRRRRQHRRRHVAQQVAVALDVGPQARVLALLLVETWQVLYACCGSTLGVF